MSPRKRQTNVESVEPQEPELRATANPSPRTATGTRSGQSPATAEVAQHAEPSRDSVRVSPAPRPPKQKLPDDPFVKYDADMRVQAADLYRRLLVGPVPIMSVPSAMPEVVQWMRNKGVRIKAHLTAGPTVYELEPRIEG